MSFVVEPLILVAIIAFPVAYVVHIQQAPMARLVGKRELRWSRYLGAVLVAGIALVAWRTEPSWWTDGTGNAVAAATAANILYLCAPLIGRFLSGSEDSRA